MRVRILRDDLVACTWRTPREERSYAWLVATGSLPCSTEEGGRDACAGQPLPPTPSPSRVAATPSARATATPASANPTSAPTGPTRFELVADLAGAVGLTATPAAGELSCRGRVLIVLDMRPRPPLGLVTASFEIEMESCPEGTVVTDGHVHAYVQPHPDRIHIGAAITRPSPLGGGSGVITSTNQGVDPRLAAEVLAAPTSFGSFLHTERDPVGGAGRGSSRPGSSSSSQDVSRPPRNVTGP